MIKYFAGVDVQISKGCSYYILDNNKNFVTSGWIKENISLSFQKLFLNISNNQLNTIAIGIDAPRMPIKKLRKRSFDKKTNSWIEKGDGKLGRECEVIIKSYNLANPQWTRTYAESPKWMQLGFKIFSELKDFPSVYEVFPSASYRILEKEKLKYELCLNDFVSGVKDMLDASVAAITVYEFLSGRGCEVGGDDGLGTIILPRNVSWLK